MQGTGNVMLFRAETQAWRIHFSGERQQMSLSDELCQPASWTGDSVLTPVLDCGPAARLSVWMAAPESMRSTRVSKSHHKTSRSQLIPKCVCLCLEDLARFFGFLGVLSKRCIFLSHKTASCLRTLQGHMLGVRYAP